MTAEPIPSSRPDRQDVPRAYAWLAFALTMGLLFSDYASRQVLIAVFPQLRAAWHLSDTRLGSLVSVVGLTAGVFTIPISVLADRFGRVRSIVVMAMVWNGAALACGLAQSYGAMFAAEALIGLGEAAFGAIALAVLMEVFPVRLRGTISGTFLAGAILGSVVGMTAGSAIAARLGWRAAFIAIAAFGFALAVVYPLVVRETRGDGGRDPSSREPPSLRSVLEGLFATPALVLDYVGSGTQLFVTMSVLPWLPTYFQRYHGLSAQASVDVGAGFLMLTAFGMVFWGSVTDRLCRHRPEARTSFAGLYCLAALVLFALAFRLPSGALQLITLGAALFFSNGALGPAGAIAADQSDAAVHGAVFAVVTLANNLLGIAPGPLATGWLADHGTLLDAMHLTTFAGVVPTAAFFLARYSYRQHASTH